MEGKGPRGRRTAVAYARRILAILALCAGCASAPKAPSHTPAALDAPVARTPDMPLAVVPDAPPPKPAVRIVHHAEWPVAWDVRELGIDRAAKRVFVELSWNGVAPFEQKPVERARFVVDEIDVESGGRMDRWEASEALATRLANRRGEGPPVADLLRFASIARRFAPPYEHFRSFLHVGVTADAKHVFYEALADDGSREMAQMIAAADGSRARRFDAGLRVSYDLASSPDSKWGAFHGYSNGIYHLYLRGTAQADRVVKVNAIVYPKKLYWSKDDGSVYVLSTGADQKHPCIHAVHPTAPQSPRVVLCGDVIDETSHFVLSRDGKTALVASRASTKESLWIRLADGAILRRFSVPAYFGALSDDGILVAPSKEGLRVVDLRTTNEKEVREAGFVALHQNMWLDEHTLLGVRHLYADHAFEIVALDVARILAEKGEGPVR